jgi:SAM-dependent methyltransferase
VRYRTTILLGAFLLFQIQPQIARVVLPWFGGGPAVWSACLLFFQVQLLGGYAYAHLLHRYLTPRSQAALHVSLLAASLLFLPIVPGEHWQPHGTEDPTLHILLLLFATVGLPYMLLAATGPILQSWFAREFRGRSPYRLYALSNIGSLAALISFPFVFEPNLTIGVQANLWAAAYVGFAMLTGACAWSASKTPDWAGAQPTVRAATASENDLRQPVAVDAITQAFAKFALQPAFTSGLNSTTANRVRAETTQLVAERPVKAAATATATPTPTPTANATDAQPTTTPAPGHRQILRWIALATLPSVMLLAVTNVICIDVAVIPFFWVMPLAIYLLTFVLTFDGQRWYRPVAMGATLAAIAILLLLCAEASWFAGSVAVQATAFAAVLFLCGMVCHGELVRQKPAPAHLTGFYLAVATGGAIGGTFVAIAAPLLFDTYLELELGLGCCAVVGLFACAQQMADPEVKVRLLKRRVMPFGIGVAVAAAIVVSTSDSSQSIDRSRNFFGRITVQQLNKRQPQADSQSTVQTIRRLRHGSTLHGEQITGEAVEAGMGHTYFGAESGVAYALRNHPDQALRPLRVGIIGLGTGTLAYYANKLDQYTFYEINPAIVHAADTHFTYVADARKNGATVNVQLGDARVQMARALQQSNSGQFDVLVIDAFSSDSIPVHLLTREANRIYWQHLKPDGILLAHVSNRHLDLIPVVRGLAIDAEKQLRLVTVQSEDTNTNTGSAWAILTDNEAFLAAAAMRNAPDARERPSLLWTDDFSSLWHVIR